MYFLDGEGTWEYNAKPPLECFNFQSDTGERRIHNMLLFKNNSPGYTFKCLFMLKIICAGQTSSKFDQCYRNIVLAFMSPNKFIIKKYVL